ncbi:MAG: V-type ATP synthase subunit D [Burkholderiaceae bacterium]|nr:V-type ATP synthase subunit D [Burkholderiaceae bacterium]
MADFTPTRSLAIALAEERRTMREGYAFLDEKCLLLAGEMLREVRQWQQRSQAFRAAWREVQQALRAAIARHGLQGLQLYPARTLVAELTCQRRTLLGVAMQSATLDLGGPIAASTATSAATSATASTPLEPAANPSPEAEVCRRAFAALLPQLVALAALSGDLARLHAEYKRTVRRVRALQDVLLPEVERTLADIEASLEELEQDEAAVLRRIATGANATRAG